MSLIEDMESDFQLFKQGAEGRLFKGNYLGNPTIVKERFVKKYRHPDLDEHLTKERMKSEARAIIRCKTIGVRTPALYLVDFLRRRIYMEYVEDSITAKKFILDATNLCSTEEDAVVALEPIAREIGTVLGNMHLNNIIHGDLTTSNMLVVTKHGLSNIILIDFGLSHVENSAEDKAVDLYVLERALFSTHTYAQCLFDIIIETYKKSNLKEHKMVLEKLNEVRSRGRKRTMVG